MLPVVFVDRLQNVNLSLAPNDLAAAAVGGDVWLRSRPKVRLDVVVVAVGIRQEQQQQQHLYQTTTLDAERRLQRPQPLESSLLLLHYLFDHLNWMSSI